MKRVDILKGALAKLERDGWCQDSFGVNDGPTCLIGAVYYSTYGDVRGCLDFDSDRSKKTSLIAGDILRAAKVKRRHDRLVKWQAYDWNDKPGRTAEQVKRVLKRAIRSLEKR